MTRSKGHVNEDHQILSPLLKQSICKKGQIVCINFLKQKNIHAHDIWYKTQYFLFEAGGHEFYGTMNWDRYDFQNGSKVIHKFFLGKTLIVTGHYSEVKRAFVDFSCVDVYETKKNQASMEYDKYKADLYSMLGRNSYDNVVFACGPIGKVLLADMIGLSGSNLIDVGSLMNAIVNSYSTGKPLIEQWPMSWTKILIYKSCLVGFLMKLGVINE